MLCVWFLITLNLMTPNNGYIRYLFHIFPVFAQIRNKTNVPTKIALQVFVCGIHWNCVCGIHLHFGTYFKTCLWNPGTYRHKIVLLSTAQFGLVMLIWMRTFTRYGHQVDNFHHGQQKTSYSNAIKWSRSNEHYCLTPRETRQNMI